MDKPKHFSLTDMVNEAGKTAKEKGWWDEELIYAVSFINILAEIGEAREWDRDDMSDHIPEYKGVEEELADILIRCFDLAARVVGSRKFLDAVYKVAQSRAVNQYMEAENDLSYLIAISIRVFSDESTRIDFELFDLVTDVTKLWEAYRLHGNTVDFQLRILPAYLAQIVIRTCAIAERHNLRLEDTVLAKMEFNKTRPYRHGGKVA